MLGSTRTTATIEDSLEVIPPEGLEGQYRPAAATRAREPFHVTPKQIGLLAGMAVAGALFAAYAALAIGGVRSLERDRARATALTAERERLSNRLLASVVTRNDTSVVAEATKALLLEHRDRAVALADHAAGTRAVDPGVKSLRTAVVEALRRDAHDLEHAAQAPLPEAQPEIGRGYPHADRVLDETRKQWRLKPGKAITHADPPNPPLKAAASALIRLATWSEERTGVRLLVNGDDGLRMLDLDDSRPEPIVLPEGVGEVAAGPGFIAVASGRSVVLIDSGDLDGRQEWVVEEPADRTVLSDAAGTGVWVQHREDLSLVHLDRAATPTDRTARVHGMLVADLGPTLLWTRPVDEDLRGPPPYLGDYTLSNSQTGDVVTQWQGRELLAASAHGMVWRVGGQTLEVMDPAGHVRPVPTRGDRFPRAAAFAPDGDLAVGWGDGRLDVIDVASQAVTATVLTGGTASLHWNPTSQLVFFTSGTGMAWYRPGEADVHRLRLRAAGGADGFLVAAF